MDDAETRVLLNTTVSWQKFKVAIVRVDSDVERGGDNIFI